MPLPIAGKKVAIATPALTGQVGMRYAFSLAHTMRIAPQFVVAVSPLFRGGDSLIQRVRNDLLKDALDSGVTDMVFIDEDQDWEALDFFRLLSHPVDVVGAAVRKKTDDEERYNVVASGGSIRRDGATGLLDVDAVGTGFLRLTRKAMEALWDRSEPYRDDAGRESRWVFDLGVFDGRLFGEDVVMCNKVRDAGFKVFVDPGVKVGHAGMKRWTGDFLGWLARPSAEGGGGP